ncbi:MAG: hypothetical protein E7435_03645 [Ruminococcaceae bacterium]|nr:hypothetical protein [Oscillospiraceae bacterium]
MRKLLIFIILVSILTVPVSAMEFTAPAVPDGGKEVMPEQYETFGEGLWYIIRTALGALQPSFRTACGVCLSLIAVTILITVVKGLSDSQTQVIRFVGAIMIGCLLLQQTDTFFHMGREVITQISNYGKLLLPVMAASLAAQGGVSSAAGIYGGTLLFDTVLTSAVTGLLIPLVYVYIALSIANAAFDNEALKELKTFVKWISSWVLKIILYVFTGYISITGVVSGTADASAIKAAKIAISSFVPMVGSIISDASESILVSAGLMKNAAGIYGLLSVAAVAIGPFLKIGIQYVLLKATAAVSGVIGGKEETELVKDFSVAMGYLLAMTGAVCIMLLISIVCFMKGVA